MSGLPISDYAVLSDCHSAALVSGAGSVDWLCFPRFDSPSVFARILDVDGGHWAVHPSGEFDVRRRYLDDSLVLETQFRSPGGMGMLTDALVFDRHARGHDIGKDAPNVMVRVFEVTEGELDVTVEFCPRPEYGIVRPRLELVDGMLVSRGGASILCLDGPPPDEIEDGTARWTVHLNVGDQLAFALHHVRRGRPFSKRWSERHISSRLKETLGGWESWSSLHQSYQGPAQSLVRHSGRVLQGLTYQPTGAIVAAATTSLPETAGGTRNWDYRYSWIRDASFTLKALWVAACPEEAGRFLTWIIDTAGTSLQQANGLQIMYGVGGEHDLSERELGHLAGWRDSQPVRVGNDAWDQTQVDIYGELLDAVLVLRSRLETPSAGVRRFLIDVVDCAGAAWRSPDSGIWEMRGDLRHHVYSKLMCWVALDRGLQLAEWLGAEDRAAEWDTARGEIRDAIVSRGWNESVGSFTQCFDDTNLDASGLMLAITGFLDVDDPKMVATVDCIAEALAAPCGLLYRYTSDDSLDGNEGCFLLCTYWLVECLAARGEVGHATELFERANAYANDLGLLSEEAEPMTGELMGNFPQAFSHVGLVNAAWALSKVNPPSP